MITVLAGENSFEVERALRQLVASYDGTIERIDGESVELAQIPDLVMGGTLFTQKRLVVIRGLSNNKTVWPEFSEWVVRVSDDVWLVLVEGKLDKRTKTYKTLKQQADVQEFALWGERDIAKAETWLAKQAATQGVTLDRASARLLLERVGLDQWALYHALERLSVLERVDVAVIETVIDASPTENVFNLFEAALRGESVRVTEMLRTLELTEDLYMLFGLLSGQAFQLLALAAGNGPSADIAKEVGAHPFALSKLAPHAKRLGLTGARQVVGAFAEADAAMKSSGGEPWLLLERALMKVALRQ